MKLSDHLLEDLLLGAELRVKGQEAESGKLALPGSVCPHRARSEWTGDRTPRPPVLLQKPGSEQAAVSRRADGRSPANDGAGGPVRSVGNPSPTAGSLTAFWPPTASGSVGASQGRSHSPVSSDPNLRHPGPRHSRSPPASSWRGWQGAVRGAAGPGGRPPRGDRA